MGLRTSSDIDLLHVLRQIKKKIHKRLSFLTCEKNILIAVNIKRSLVLFLKTFRFNGSTKSMLEGRETKACQVRSSFTASISGEKLH